MSGQVARCGWSPNASRHSSSLRLRPAIRQGLGDPRRAEADTRPFGSAATAERWTATGSRLRYEDPSGAAGGIQSLVVKLSKRGGALKLKAGTDAWRYRLDAPQGPINVTVEIGTSRWCAEFGPKAQKQRGAKRLRATARVSPGACPCDALVAGTFDGVLSIFEQHGCTSAVCHGAVPGEGGLDLRREVAWANLVGVPGAPPVASHRIRAASPNPSAGAVRIEFELARAGAAEFRLRDVAGRTVATIPAGRREAGVASFVLDGGVGSGTARDVRRVAAGVYFLSLVVDGVEVDGRRIVLLR